MKKQSLKQLQVKIWDECKRIIKVRYGNDCYTCDAKNLQGSNRHTGHLIPKKYLPYEFKYDLRFLRPQCYNCNMNLGGMGALYLYRLMEENDFEARDEIHIFIHSVKYEKAEQKVNKPNPKEVELFYKELLERLKLINK